MASYMKIHHRLSVTGAEKKSMLSNKISLLHLISPFLQDQIGLKLLPKLLWCLWCKTWDLHTPFWRTKSLKIWWKCLIPCTPTSGRRLCQNFMIKKRKKWSSYYPRHTLLPSLHHSWVEIRRLVLQTCHLYESHTSTNLAHVLTGIDIL